MKIKYLELHNFRSIKSLRLDFSSQCNMAIVGANGIGKTSIIDAIWLLLSTSSVKRGTSNARNVIRESDFYFGKRDLSVNAVLDDGTSKIEYSLISSLTDSGVTTNITVNGIGSTDVIIINLNNLKQVEFQELTRYSSYIRDLVDQDFNEFLSSFAEEESLEQKIKKLSNGQATIMNYLIEIAKNFGDVSSQKAKGIVLIDQIENYLHVGWQQKIARLLTQNFPQLQFIFTTYSPVILGSVQHTGILALMEKGGLIAEEMYVSSYGQDANRIINKIMGASERDPIIKKDIVELFQMVSDEEISKAVAAKSDMERLLGKDDPELIRAGVLINRRLRNSIKTQI